MEQEERTVETLLANHHIPIDAGVEYELGVDGELGVEPGGRDLGLDVGEVLGLAEALEVSGPKI